MERVGVDGRLLPAGRALAAGDAGGVAGAPRAGGGGAHPRALRGAHGGRPWRSAWRRCAATGNGPSRRRRWCPVPRDGPLPLSFAQQRLWFIEQLEPGRAPPTTSPWRCGCAARWTWTRWSGAWRRWRGGTRRCAPCSAPPPTATPRRRCWSRGPSPSGGWSCPGCRRRSARRGLRGAGPRRGRGALRPGGAARCCAARSSAWARTRRWRSSPCTTSSATSGPRPSWCARCPRCTPPSRGAHRRRSPSCRCSTPTTRPGSARWLTGETLGRQLAFWRERLRGASAAAGAAHGPPPPGRDESARRRGHLSPPGGAGGRAARAVARGGRHAVHDAAGGLPGAAGPLRRHRRRAGGDAGGRPHAPGDRGADRLLRQHPGPPRRPVRRPRRAGAARPRRASGCWRRRRTRTSPSSGWWTSCGWSASFGHTPLFQVMLTLADAGGEELRLGAGGGGAAGDGHRGDPVRPGAGARRRGGRAARPRGVPRGAVGRGHGGPDDGALPRAAGGDGGPPRGARLRPAAAAPGRARTGGGALERHRPRLPPRPHPARGLRRAGRPHARRRGRGVRGRRAELRRAGRPRLRRGRTPPRPRRRPRGARGDLRDPRAGDARRHPGRAGGGRRLRAAGPRLPGGPPAPGAGGRRRAGAADAGVAGGAVRVVPGRSRRAGPAPLPPSSPPQAGERGARHVGTRGPSAWRFPSRNGGWRA